MTPLELEKILKFVSSADEREKIFDAFNPEFRSGRSHPLEKPRDSTTAILVFRQGGGYKAGHKLISLVWIGPRSQVERELTAMLSGGNLTRARHLIGIDFEKGVRFPITVVKIAGEFTLAMPYLSKKRNGQQK
jgi:hypothetical protein